MAEETAEAKSSGGGKGLLIALIVLVVILLIAIGVGGYLLYSKGAFGGDDQTQQTQQMPAKAEAGDSKETFNVAINDLVLNITNAKGREKLMKLSFTLKSTEPTIEGIVEGVKAEIVDIVISQISARSSEELLTVGGKELLKEELLEEINMIINEATVTNEDIPRNNIKKIFFTSFVIK